MPCGSPVVMVLPSLSCWRRPSMMPLPGLYHPVIAGRLHMQDDQERFEWAWLQGSMYVGFNHVSMIIPIDSSTYNAIATGMWL